ncbi:putative trafficking protein particle complex subunit 2 protein [Phaeoacremonium minimum UCRPA7]|uniref:Putative trafficking protein particle complex subunit 2 protein n=1 Tax=Phaeoacremonium minimum (strain UCR-PA7) TaxID=1286976 RepID=R8BFN5_PHAM7|nr:putative trafficking protein particle complex subunit 2 protein [Phaeoacremonium minimum UCRPA7]EON98113.1 putative trafficking protein particle complex subunit 2 protein [Phaeoacremonium minimum UCRPA7]
MSYYFAIIGTQDNPLFEYEFGTSKQGGDGQPRFSDQARHLNQFILHSSLDVVEEVQWNNGQMYLKVIDKFFNNYISCFMTGANAKFLLLHQPTTAASTASSRSSTSIAANPTSPATEEAIKNFFMEVYDSWVKAIMSPFYKVNMEVRSPVFRARVAAAGRKYL